MPYHNRIGCVLGFLRSNPLGSRSCIWKNLIDDDANVDLSIITVLRFLRRNPQESWPMNVKYNSWMFNYDINAIYGCYVHVCNFGESYATEFSLNLWTEIFVTCMRVTYVKIRKT